MSIRSKRWRQPRINCWVTVPGNTLKMWKAAPLALRVPVMLPTGHLSDGLQMKIQKLYLLQSLYTHLFKPQWTIYFRNVFPPGLLKRFWLSPRKGMLSSLFFRYLDSSPKFSPLSKKIVIIFYFFKNKVLFSLQ